MPRIRKEKKLRIITELQKLYPDPETELDYKNSFELLVAVILSAQCTDKKVNEVTPALFKDYPNFKKLSKAKLEDIKKIIKPINYYKTKSKHLILMANRVVDVFDNKLPTQFDDLISLNGVGQKTANVVQSELGIRPAIAVDTHVFRVSQRLGFAKGKTPNEIEEQLKKGFKKELWRDLHHWLILHGRRVCKAQKPLCSSCSLAKDCPSSNIKLIK